ncbi:hypothetical protein EJB05_52511 [Eragrostis curvula]|uniref:Uncharacterized protein n=1 Tax=Eragrostis curvula TaxID=38414 RepID=A0A5J9SSL9_9POAL|nr:hypothetical protein EJB05_52511 [Eragrostis curvula]
MAACNIRQCFLIKVSTTIREDVPAAGDMLGACNDWSTARSSTTRERGSKHYGGLRVKRDGYAHECRICPLKALARHLLTWKLGQEPRGVVAALERWDNCRLHSVFVLSRAHLLLRKHNQQPQRVILHRMDTVNVSSSKCSTRWCLGSQSSTID